MSEQNGTIVEGGGTAGLREAALAKRAAQKEAPAPTAAPVAPANDNGDLDPSERAELETLASRPGELPSAPTASEETITVAGHEIPVSVIEQLPDEVLKRIKRKLKAGHGDVEVTLLDALRAVPLAHGAQKRMWEAAQREKEVNSIAEIMPDDPVGAIARLKQIPRHEALAIFEKHVLREAERAEMTPEERAELDRRAELEAKAARADEYERAEQERQHKEATAQAREQILAGMAPALEAAGLKANKYTMQRVAHILGTAIDDGVISIPTPADLAWAASTVAQERQAENEQYEPADDIDGEALIARYGEARAKKIARAYAQRIAKQREPVRTSNGNGAKPKQPQGDRPKTWKEFLADADKRMGIRR